MSAERKTYRVLFDERTVYEIVIEADTNTASFYIRVALHNI